MNNIEKLLDILETTKWQAWYRYLLLFLEKNHDKIKEKEKIGKFEFYNSFDWFVLNSDWCLDLIFNWEIDSLGGELVEFDLSKNFIDQDEKVIEKLYLFCKEILKPKK